MMLIPLGQACTQRQPLARALPAFLLATAACAGERTSDMAVATTLVDTVAGVVHVVNTGTAPEWELDLVASIGPESAMEEGTPRAFGAVSSVTFGPYRNFIDENPSADCEPRRPEKPAVKPFVEALFVAPGGRLWVEVARDAGNRWEVFDVDGALVGGLPVLDRTVALAFGPERIATVRRDSLGIDRVEVHRVVEGSSGR